MKTEQSTVRCRGCYVDLVPAPKVPGAWRERGTVKLFCTDRIPHMPLPVIK